MSTLRTILELLNTLLILSFQICCCFFLNIVFGSYLVATLVVFKRCFESVYLYHIMIIITMTPFGFYIVISFCVYIFMFIVWVIIILICSWCRCCCCWCWSFCCFIMVTICCCSPDIGVGETDVSTPCAAFGADRGSWSYLNKHSATWLLLLLHLFVRKYLHTILLKCSFFLCLVHEFMFVSKIVLTCLAFKSLDILLVYSIIISCYESLMDIPAL